LLKVQMEPEKLHDRLGIQVLIIGENWKSMLGI
jgi:hypothetical protein